MAVVNEIKAIKDHIIVTEMQFGARKLASGIIIPNDNGKSEGIRPRWGKVYAVGPDQEDVKVGEWVLVDHGRWTRGVPVTFNGDGHETVIRRIDPKDILLVSDEEPTADTFSDKV